MPQVLVAEDVAAISLALEDALEEGDLTVAGPFASCTAALAWLRDHTPEVAVLDYLLTDGPSTGLALELRRRCVPFVFVSGYWRPDLPTELQEVPWIEKPLSIDDLLDALSSIRPARGGP